MSKGEMARELFINMDAAYYKHDWPSVFAYAHKLLQQLPLDAYIIEKLAALFIDFGMADEAQQVTKFMQKHFSLNGYRYFWLGRTAQLKNDYAKAIELVETGVSDSQNKSWQNELMHNILGRMYKEVGENEQAVI